VLGFVVDGPGGFPYVREAFSLAAVVGAILGTVLVPISTWGFLRRAPLGRIFGWTTIGTTAGGTLGLLITRLDPVVATLGATLGFCLSVAAIRVLTKEVGRSRSSQNG
jgi:hypothetical protein